MSEKSVSIFSKMNKHGILKIHGKLLQGVKLLLHKNSKPPNYIDINIQCKNVVLMKSKPNFLPPTLLHRKGDD